MSGSVKSKRVADAYERLKQEIRSNRIPPGYQALEPEIALRLGMSRTPVREALIRLEAEGLVELIPRRGARILPIRVEDMREIYEILTALEPVAAASLAARKTSDAELAPLEEATAEMARALERDDLDTWAEADDRFHRTLLDLHGNRRMSAYLGALCDQAHRARIFTLRLRDMPEKSIVEHNRILDCIRRGDPDGARQAIASHRGRTVSEILALLETYRLPQL